MIKRPLLWCAVTYLGGTISAVFLYKLPINFLFLGCVISVLLYLLCFLIQKDYLIFFLPILFLISFLKTEIAFRPNLLEEKFEEKQKARVEGTIYRIEEKEEKQTIYLKQTVISLDNLPETQLYHCNKILAYVSGEKDYQVGNLVFISGQIVKFRDASNFGEFDEKKYYMAQGIDYKFYGEQIKVLERKTNVLTIIMIKIKETLSKTYDKIAIDTDIGIIKAMVLGKKSEMDEEIKDLYQRNGIAHILAISGLHISLLGMGCYHLLKKSGIGIFPAVGISIFFLFCYGIITNFSISSMRAIFMLSISLIAKLVGKTYDLLSALAFSLIFILIKNPLQIYDNGFWLSFGAVWAVGFLAPIIEDVLDTQKKLSSLIISFSVFIVTLPIILNAYYTFPLYGVFLNLIVIPFMSLVMPLSLLAGLIGIVNLSIGQFLMGGVHYILLFYEKICIFFTKLPFNNIILGKPTIGQIIFYYVILAAILFLFSLLIKRQQFSKGIIFSFLFLFLVWIHFPNKDLSIEFLDVGQGDSICIQTPNNRVYTIDGGSSDIKQVGEYRLEPYLKARGISKIDYAILTHMDADHTNGIIELLKKSKDGLGNIQIKNIVITQKGLEQKKHEELELLAKKSGTSILYIKKGDKLYDGEVSLSCLHPSLDFLSNSENSYSVVLSLTYGSFSALFTGDLEQDGEILLKKEDLLPYTILKVAHHGSKYSTDIEFLKKVHPIVSIISCGKNNRYGHPHNELIERIENEGGKIEKTMDLGAIRIKTNGKKTELFSFR